MTKESKHLHISPPLDKMRGDSRFVLSRTDSKKVVISSVAYMSLNGHTEGLVKFNTFWGGEEKKEKWHYSLSLQTAVHTWSEAKRLSGEIFFPKFRKPTEEVTATIKEFDEAIRNLQEKKQQFITDIFESQPLLRLSDLPDEFLNPVHPGQKETLDEIINHLKGR
jgi:hypothetical protein